MAKKQSLLFYAKDLTVECISADTFLPAHHKMYYPTFKYED